MNWSMVMFHMMFSASARLQSADDDSAPASDFDSGNAVTSKVERKKADDKDVTCILPKRFCEQDEDIGGGLRETLLRSQRKIALNEENSF
jgi:hypothetical protein